MRTDRHEITEILLKVALNNINQIISCILYLLKMWLHSQRFPLNSFQTLSIGLFQTLKCVSKHVIKLV
jgi:hypothetical protein